MSILKINETPVRTSRNFNINNIKLDDVEIPENIGSFDNVEIINSTSEITVEKSNNNFNLTYGIGDILVKKVKEEVCRKCFHFCSVILLSLRLQM